MVTWEILSKYSQTALRRPHSKRTLGNPVAPRPMKSRHLVLETVPTQSFPQWLHQQFPFRRPPPFLPSHQECSPNTSYQPLLIPLLVPLPIKKRKMVTTIMHRFQRI
ncbi:uncharacterized protein LOC129745499 [Uranotaenia lowii]|uniref:uncharacterized protein LOC129745499 n=1 Tax=Uranotaenia lowii TaxID=190385 RepID=UPI00247AA258|nr:uncharacterized protein LOC129745499 [Uranotaenia lowii]